VPAEPPAGPQPADSPDPLQRIMPLMVDARGETDLARWTRLGPELERRAQLLRPDGQPMGRRAAAESIEADVMAGRL
jgi:hypothetical protein